MRFEVLALPAYGPFTNATLDLRDGLGKLQIVYGPNEAGKSSLLRALTDFLFGIHGQTPDNFLHPYANLRIRATLERGGERLDCVRRKANTRSLRAAGDDEPIPEELFRAFVPLENRDIFEKMFGLDAERLREGGHELLEGRSEFGQLLFSAAAGIEGLHATLKSLTEQAEKLFKPKASTTRLAGILERLKQSKDRLRQAQVSLTDLNQRQEDCQSAREESSRLEAERLGQQSEKERLKRIQISLRLLGSRREDSRQLSALGNVPVLRDGFAAEHQEAAAALDLAARAVRDSARRVAELERELEGIVPPPAVLAREHEILELQQGAGACRQAEADRPKRVAELERAHTEMRHLLRELGEREDLEAVTGLVAPAADRGLVNDLADRRARLDTEMANQQARVAEEQGKLDRARGQLKALPALLDVEALRAELERARLAEAAEAQAGKLERAWTEESLKLEQDGRALPWPAGVEALENSALPVPELVTEWRSRLDQAERAQEHAKQRVREAQLEVPRREGELAALQAGRSVPSLERLEGKRQRRDLGWQAVRRAWLESEPDSAEARRFLERPGDAPALAQAYEESVAAADQTADELREHADHVVRLAQARLAVEGARRDAETHGAALAGAQAECTRLQEEWAALWMPFQVTASAPLQMADWLRRRERLIERLRAWREGARQARELREEAEIAQLRLRERLREIGETRLPSADSLAGWRSLAESVVREQEKLARERGRLTDQTEDSQTALDSARALLATAGADLDGWHRSWSEIMTRLGLPLETEPSAAQEIIRVREQLQTRADAAAGLEKRIKGIDRDRAEFDQRLGAVLEAAAPDLRSRPSLEAAAQLQLHLGEAKKQRELRSTREQDLARERAALAQAERALRAADECLAALAVEAGCEGREHLPEAIQASATRRELVNRLRDTEGHLTAIAGGRSLADLEEEARGVEADQIPGLIEAIDRELERGRALLRSADDRRITREGELRRMEEAADACGAAADLEACNEDAREATEEYIRLRLARLVLQGAVDQYREKTQGDMLRRSSELFSRLTSGSFAGLKLDSDEAGKAVLLGVRSQTGEQVSLEGMSDGTRDQLYLALRLASMGLYVRDHEPMPFILDDILVKFDDERAVAALRALADLAQGTQVLLFTHHSHLVELAKANLPPDALAVSEIACQFGAPRQARAMS